MSAMYMYAQVRTIFYNSETNKYVPYVRISNINLLKSRQVTSPELSESTHNARKASGTHAVAVPKALLSILNAISIELNYFFRIYATQIYFRTSE